MRVGESGCPGTRYAKAYLVFEVYESHAHDDRDKENEVGVCVWEGRVRVVRRVWGCGRGSVASFAQAVVSELSSCLGTGCRAVVFPTAAPWCSCEYG